jgi:hypothetical protein
MIPFVLKIHASIVQPRVALIHAVENSPARSAAQPYAKGTV